VRICPSPRGPLQAVGLDGMGRVQYRYGEKFRARREEAKYAKLIPFGECLPALRRVTNEHIALDGLPLERVLAVMVRLVADLYFRVGSEKGAKEFRTYGITTLQNRHFNVGADGIATFRFVGKHQVVQRRLLTDAALAEVLCEIKALRGSRLFQYVGPSGRPTPVKPFEVNAYVKAAMGPEFSAKDFRTWGGTLRAALALADLPAPETDRQREKNIVAATKQVAEHLGNTPAVCRSSYVHPKVFAAYREGVTLADFRPRRTRATRKIQPDYEPEEVALLELLRGAVIR
jgi:DNA topoisomerase I